MNLFRLFILSILTIWCIGDRCLADDVVKDAERVASGFISQYRTKNGTCPSDLVFEKWVYDQRDLTEQYKNALWGKWEYDQRPSLKLADLEKLIAGQREAVAPIHLEYTVTIEGQLVNDKIVPEGKSAYSWWMSGKKLRLDTHEEDTGVPRDQKESFDGEKVRIMRIPYGEAPIAMIQAFESRKPFFEISSPWSAEMLLNSERDCEAKLRTRDLLLLLKEGGYIEEAGDILDGRPMLVVCFAAPVGWKVWLDPKQNYCVVRMAEFAYNPVTAQSLNYLRVCKSIKDRGNGIYLPDDVVEEWYNLKGIPGEDKIGRRRIHLKTVECGNRIPDGVFSDIFPAGTQVLDARLSSVYVEGKHADVPDILNKAVDNAKRERK